MTGTQGGGFVYCCGWAYLEHFQWHSRTVTLLTHNTVAAVIGLPGAMTDQRPGPDQAKKQYTDHSWWHVTDFQDIDELRPHDLREPDEKSIRRANQRKQAEYISERRKRGRERGEERATQAAEGDTEESEFWSKTPET